jgi:hypothetical protein
LSRISGSLARSKGRRKLRDNARCLLWVKRVVLTGYRRLPVAPDQRTELGLPGWSGSCQNRKWSKLLDHLIGERQQIRGNADPECLRGLEIDNQIEFSLLVKRDVPWPGSFEDFIDDVGDATRNVDNVN